MESGPFLDARVREQFRRFVLVVLHTDGWDNERYRESSMRNAALLRERFKTRSIPFYVAMDPSGREVYWTGGVVDAGELAGALAKVPKTFRAEGS